MSGPKKDTTGNLSADLAKDLSEDLDGPSATPDPVSIPKEMLEKQALQDEESKLLSDEQYPDGISMDFSNTSGNNDDDPAGLNALQDSDFDMGQSSSEPSGFHDLPDGSLNEIDASRVTPAFGSDAGSNDSDSGLPGSDSFSENLDTLEPSEMPGREPGMDVVDAEIATPAAEPFSNEEAQLDGNLEQTGRINLPKPGMPGAEAERVELPLPITDTESKTNSKKTGSLSTGNLDHSGATSFDEEDIDADIDGDQRKVKRPSIQAAFPFSLMIQGALKAVDREKLVDLLARFEVGISEEDLGPQFRAGRILIPKISEFTGVCIVQALRDTAAEMKLAPSDQVFKSDSSEEDDLAYPGYNESFKSSPDVSEVFSDSPTHPADDIPVLSAESLPGFSDPKPIDTITASTTLDTPATDPQRSQEFQELIEALQREVRFKAYRRGAKAVVQFKVSLTRLSLPSKYKLIATGTAIK